jgi:transposase
VTEFDKFGHLQILGKDTQKWKKKDENILMHQKKAVIIKMRMQEMTCEQIAMHFGVHKSTIYRFFVQYDMDGRIAAKVRSGRPPKIQVADLQKLALDIKRDRLITLQSLQQDNNLTTVSKSTISRKIKSCTFYKSKQSAKKPFVSKANMKKRVKWCKERLTWSQDDWNHAVWSDESSFRIRNLRKFRVWRRKGETIAQKCTRATLKHDKKINVWGCFSAHSVGTFYRIEGIMTREQYLQILQNVAEPSCMRLFPDEDYMFQQDNDPKHTAKATTEWIRRNLNTIEWWPPQSPDLNPIENLWSILDLRTKHRQCKNEDELFSVLQEEWNALPPSILTNLVNSMPKRLKQVIKNHGAAIGY